MCKYNTSVRHSYLIPLKCSRHFIRPFPQFEHLIVKEETKELDEFDQLQRTVKVCNKLEHQMWYGIDDALSCGQENKDR